MSILKTLLESETCVNENINLNYTMNSYRSLMESLEVETNTFKYTPEMVPIIKCKDCCDYIIFIDDVKRLANQNECTLSEAMNLIFEAYEDQEVKLDKDNTKVAITEEDPDEIEKAAKCNPTKMAQKVKKVEEFTESIDALIDSGIKVVKMI